ncbi:hypothetical protein RSOLAG1IB_11806 [Rhizoctonia solani AG-1 IB]|uniref:Uncharacterized protein n=1 Tax=Thanatephorus cucumeris (strain AG1-IB / isolate 7/3/14) TaxID=1108050 RepID=A0A0B7FDL2_THACB|nr:hypothetical protein RSOLAG1IB_11806 [Rhizoctonia solani AG-1 IB]
MKPTLAPVRQLSYYLFTAGKLVDCGVYRASLFCVRSGSLDTAGAEPPKYQAFCAMLRTIREQEEDYQPTPAPNMDLIAASMRDLAIAIEGTNRTAPKAPALVHRTTNLRERNTQVLNVHPTNAPTGPKATRNPLSTRIGAQITPYERPKVRGGAKRKEWMERKSGKEWRSECKETEKRKETARKKETSANEESTTNDKVGTSGCNNMEMAGRPTGTIPDLSQGTHDLRTLQTSSPEQEVINDDDWDWEKFIDSEAD